MVDPIRIDKKTFVSGQIEPDEVPELAASGFRLIVNNRPDGEAPEGQPFALEIEAAAKEQGVGFANLPFTAQTLTPDYVAEFAAILRKEDGPVLAYCKSGVRSSMLWAAAQVALGEDLDTVLEKTEQAGFNLRSAAPVIDALGRKAGAT